MSEAIDRARDRIAEVAAELAGKILDAPDSEAKALCGRADALSTTAEAVSKVAFGPQGWVGDTTYDYTTRSGEPQRRQPGFGRGDERDAPAQ